MVKLRNTAQSRWFGRIDLSFSIARTGVKASLIAIVRL